MKFTNSYFTVILSLLLLLIISCKKGITNTEIMPFSIDLSLQEKQSISTYKIESDGTVTVLKNNVNEISNIYQVHFSKEEMSNIKKNLDKITLDKCDSINETYADGLRYLLVLNNKGKETILINNTCEELKPLDDLVMDIINTYNKKEKKPFFKSLKRITPTPQRTQTTY